jgi:hypothetical protein
MEARRPAPPCSRGDRSNPSALGQTSTDPDMRLSLHPARATQRRLALGLGSLIEIVIRMGPRVHHNIFSALKPLHSALPHRRKCPRTRPPRTRSTNHSFGFQTARHPASLKIEAAGARIQVFSSFFELTRRVYASSDRVSASSDIVPHCRIAAPDRIDACQTALIYFSSVYRA